MRTSNSALFPLRAAFTLVELLVVVAIIAVIASLTASAFMQVITVQKRSNTEQTIKTLSSLLDRQWRAVIDQAKNEDIPSSVLAMAGNNTGRARLMWIKLRLKQEFPMNFSEALYPWMLPPPLSQPMGQPNPYLGPNDLPAKPSYTQALRGAGI